MQTSACVDAYAKTIYDAFYTHGMDTGKIAPGTILENSVVVFDKFMSVKSLRNEINLHKNDESKRLQIIFVQVARQCSGKQSCVQRYDEAITSSRNSLKLSEDIYHLIMTCPKDPVLVQGNAVHDGIHKISQSYFNVILPCAAAMTGNKYLFIASLFNLINGANAEIVVLNEPAVAENKIAATNTEYVLGKCARLSTNDTTDTGLIAHHQRTFYCSLTIIVTRLFAPLMSGNNKEIVFQSLNC
jgi:hypothetical protein